MSRVAGPDWSNGSSSTGERFPSSAPSSSFDASSLWLWLWPDRGSSVGPVSCRMMQARVRFIAMPDTSIGSDATPTEARVD